MDSDDRIAACPGGTIGLETIVPPEVIDVDRNADLRRVQMLDDVVGLGKRIDRAAAVGVHRMQRLDGERHARRLCVLEQLTQAVAYHFAGACQILRYDIAASVLRESANDQHQAARSQGKCFVDCATIVIERCTTAFAIRRGKHPAAAKP